MTKKQEYINLITEKLKSTINPYKVILFGSYAYGNTTKDSDIDILIVTNDNYYPKNYSEKMDRYLKVSKILSQFKKKFQLILLYILYQCINALLNLAVCFQKKY